MLFGEPRTEIDEPAAIAAERPELRRRRPFHIAPARGTFDYRTHQPVTAESTTAGQNEGHIHLDVRRTRRGIQPVQEANGAAMLIGAHFRKQLQVRGQRHANQLAGIFAIELQLIDAANRDFRLALGVLPGEPQQFGDAVA